MITIGDPRNKIVIAVNRGDDEEAVARAYASAIQALPNALGLDSGWNAPNLAIVARWGDEGRERVKERAWAMLAEAPQ